MNSRRGAFASVGSYNTPIPYCYSYSPTILLYRTAILILHNTPNTILLFLYYAFNNAPLAPQCGVPNFKERLPRPTKAINFADRGAQLTLLSKRTAAAGILARRYTDRWLVRLHMH